MLADTDELKVYLDLDDVENQDELIDLLLIGADAYIRTYCGREFESLRRVRTLDAVDYSNIWVPDFPLTIVHGMTAFTGITDTIGMSCDMGYVSWYESGLIYSGEQLFCPSFPKNVIVDYTAGYVPGATDFKTLKWICLEIASQMFRNRGIANIQSYSAGGVQWQKYVSDIMPALGPEVLAILNSFKRLGPRDWV
jgi:hypothetical protein